MENSEAISAGAKIIIFQQQLGQEVQHCVVTTVFELTETEILYKCETGLVSSGSPICNDRADALAIHRCTLDATDTKAGVRLDKVCAKIAQDMKQSSSADIVTPAPESYAQYCRRIAVCTGMLKVCTCTQFASRHSSRCYSFLLTAHPAKRTICFDACDFDTAGNPGCAARDKFKVRQVRG